MKVLVFGTGHYGIMFLNDKKDDVQIIGFLDNNTKLHGRRIANEYTCFSPEQLSELDFDKIVIANNSGMAIRSTIATQLLSLGVSESNIYFYPEQRIDELDPRIAFIRSFAKFAEEEGIQGNVAECGVHMGESAKYINRFFPDRVLYLFDTFEGFTQNDIDVERKLGNPAFLGSFFDVVGGGWNQSIELVMEKMFFPENVRVKKGWVPETFEDIDDTFCFVHLDMDLYQPMLAAIEFFWNRMNKGGVLLIHDYYLQPLPGVKKAVDDFEVRLGQKLIKIPFCISMIIIKQ
jgi:hypothetical protein